MTEMFELVREVREALAKAAPGPWEHQECDEGCCHWASSPADDEILRYGSLSDIELIAHTPEWLAALCDEVDRLTKTEGICHHQNARYLEMLARAEKAEAEVGRLKAESVCCHGDTATELCNMYPALQEVQDNEAAIGRVWALATAAALGGNQSIAKEIFAALDGE